MAMKKTSLGSTLTALQKAEAQVQRLRERAAAERTGHLKGLHTSFGFASRRELIDALVALDGPSGASSKTTPSNSEAPTTTRKGRARVTPGMKTDIVKAIKGGETGEAVAKRFGVSSQTVQNIKKAAGMVKARKKKARK